MRRPLTARLGRDDGQTTVLTVGLCAVLVALMLVMLAVTTVQLQHRRLQSLADSAAIAGAEELGFRLGEDPGVVLAPAADADPELLHVVLLHTTAVVAGPPALVARLADADVSDLLDDASLGAHLRGPVEDVSAAWLHAADRQALSLDPDGGAAHVARHAELTAVLETRPVVVERVGMRDRDAQRAADAVGLRRVGRERVLRVAAP